jgi:hypothetical protein
MIIFDVGTPNRILPLDVITAFQTYLNMQLAEPDALGIITLIPLVYPAIIKSDGSFEIFETKLN